MNRKEFIRNAILSVRPEDIKKEKGNFYPVGVRKDSECKPKQIGNAITLYAPDCRPEDVAVLVDLTVLNSGKKGFLFAADRFYADKSQMTDDPFKKQSIPMPVYYEELETVSADERLDYLTLQYKEGKSVRVFCGSYTSFMNLVLSSIINALTNDSVPGKATEETWSAEAESTKETTLEEAGEAEEAEEKDTGAASEEAEAATEKTAGKPQRQATEEEEKAFPEDNGAAEAREKETRAESRAESEKRREAMAGEAEETEAGQKYESLEMPDTSGESKRRENGSAAVCCPAPFMRAMYVSMLKKSGIGTVYEAGCNEEGLEKCRKMKPDLVFLEYRANGEAFVEQLAEDCPGAEIILCVDIFYAPALDTMSKYPSVIVGILEKPVREYELRELIDRVFPPENAD